MGYEDLGRSMLYDAVQGHGVRQAAGPRKPPGDYPGDFQGSWNHKIMCEAAKYIDGDDVARDWLLIVLRSQVRGQNGHDGLECNSKRYVPMNACALAAALTVARRRRDVEMQELLEAWLRQALLPFVLTWVEAIEGAKWDCDPPAGMPRVPARWCRQPVPAAWRGGLSLICGQRQNVNSLFSWADSFVARVLGMRGFKNRRQWLKRDAHWPTHLLDWCAEIPGGTPDVGLTPADRDELRDVAENAVSKDSRSWLETRVRNLTQRLWRAPCRVPVHFFRGKTWAACYTDRSAHSGSAPTLARLVTGLDTKRPLLRFLHPQSFGKKPGRTSPNFPRKPGRCELDTKDYHQGGAARFVATAGDRRDVLELPEPVDGPCLYRIDIGATVRISFDPWSNTQQELPTYADPPAVAPVDDDDHQDQDWRERLADFWRDWKGARP